MKYIMRTFVATLILGSIDAYGRDWSCNQFGSIPDIDEEWHYIKRYWENIVTKEKMLCRESAGAEFRLLPDELQTQHDMFTGYFHKWNGEFTYVRQRLRKYDTQLDLEFFNRGITNSCQSVSVDMREKYDSSNPRYYMGDAPIILPIDWKYVTLHDGLHVETNIYASSISPFDKPVVSISYIGGKYQVLSKLTKQNPPNLLYECRSNQLAAIKISLETTENVPTAITLYEYDSWSWSELRKSSLGVNECYVVFNGNALLLNKR